MLKTIRIDRNPRADDDVTGYRRHKGYQAITAVIDWKTGRTLNVFRSPVLPTERQARAFVPDWYKRQGPSYVTNWYRRNAYPFGYRHDARSH